MIYYFLFFFINLIQSDFFLLDENLKDGHIVPNTDQGHCAKTFAILEQVAPILDQNNLDWLIITDDDTILR